MLSWLKKLISGKPRGDAPLNLPAGSRRVPDADLVAHANATRREKLGYDRGAGRRTHNQRWRPVNQHPDVDLVAKIDDLRARARDLVTDRSLPHGYLQRMEDEVVGDGFSPEPGPMMESGEPWDKLADQIEKLWDRVRDGLDITRVRDWALMQRKALRCWAEAGSFLAYMPVVETDDLPVPLQIQGIEPDHLDSGAYFSLPPRGTGQRSNEIRRGVEIDAATHRIVAFHLRDPQSTRVGDPPRRILAEYCAYAFDPDRWDQVLGAPWMAPSLEDMQDLGDYFNSELVRAREHSKRSHYIKTNNPQQMMERFTEADETTLDANAPRVEPIYAGRVILGPGEEPVALSDVNVPPPGFSDFTTASTRHIAQALGPSYEALTGDHTRTHFSASRATWQRDVKFYGQLQKRLIWMFCMPIYQRFLDLAVLAGRLPMISRARWAVDADYRWRIGQCTWRTPGFTWFDPQKDVNAAEKALALGLTTRTQLCADRGLWFEDVVTKLAEEEALLKSAGVKMVSFPGDMVRMVGEPPKSAAPVGDGKPGANGTGRQANGHGGRIGAGV